ncbi:MAG: hypothetical protein LBP62_03410 [Clostridiales bacterium]|jgi:putative pyruvate formate lyase activating enzyme|nr:hypothetical protein [Clostridiales bacterium]
MFDIKKCDICPNECGVDRRKTAGKCSAYDKPVVAGYSLHFFEEPCVSGTNGSGTVFFSGCAMRCVYCQNASVSRPFNEILNGNGQKELLSESSAYASPDGVPLSASYTRIPDGRAAFSKKLKGSEISPAELADIFKKLEDAGAHNINLVSPSHFAPFIISAIKKYRPKIPVIYNTHGYEKRDTITRLNDFIDVYLTDLKYADFSARNMPSIRLKNTPDIPDERDFSSRKTLLNNNGNPPRCENKTDFSAAKELSNCPNYTEYALPAIAEMIRGKGKPVIENGLIKSGVIIRHLVIPSYLGNSIRVLETIAENFKDDALISIMSQYTPLGELRLDEKINRPLKPLEYKIILKKALELGIGDAYVQELGSCGKEFIPEFIRNYSG